MPASSRRESHAQTPSLLFDLDGTLLDSNYEHITAWRLALRRTNVEIPNAFLHRCIGMRGDLLVRAMHKEIGARVGENTVSKLKKLHKSYFDKTLASVKPLPGALVLLKTLTRLKVPWAIATGGDNPPSRK